MPTGKTRKDCQWCGLSGIFATNENHCPRCKKDRLERPYCLPGDPEPPKPRLVTFEELEKLEAELKKRYG